MSFSDSVMPDFCEALLECKWSHVEHFSLGYIIYRRQNTRHFGVINYSLDGICYRFTIVFNYLCCFCLLKAPYRYFKIVSVSFLTLFRSDPSPQIRPDVALLKCRLNIMRLYHKVIQISALKICTVMLAWVLYIFVRCSRRI